MRECNQHFTTAIAANFSLIFCISIHRKAYIATAYKKISAKIFNYAIYMWLLRTILFFPFILSLNT